MDRSEKLRDWFVAEGSTMDMLLPDDWNEGQSDTQRYKQMGNAITVNVAEAIFRKLYKEIT